MLCDTRAHVSMIFQYQFLNVVLLSYIIDRLTTGVSKLKHTCDPSLIRGHRVAKHCYWCICQVVWYQRMAVMQAVRTMTLSLSRWLIAAVIWTLVLSTNAKC